MAVETAADRGASQGQTEQAGQDIHQAFPAFIDLHGPGLHLVLQVDGQGIHQMGPAGLQCSGLFLPFPTDRRRQTGQGRVEAILQPFRRGEMQGGRDDVVAALAEVDLIVRREDDPVSPGDAADHLIDVHIGAGPRSGLEDRNRKMFLIGALGDFTGGIANRLA